MFESFLYAYSDNILLMLYVWILVFVFGLVVGSFLTVVGLRLLSGESIVFPPSKCPNCNTKLKWYDDIPVLAYILLLGKCRYCRKPISIQYPIVEAITGLSFLFIFTWDLSIKFDWKPLFIFKFLLNKLFCQYV